MSLIWVIIGTAFQLLLVWPLFLFAGIGGFGFYTILPLSCLISAIIVIYLYMHGGTAASFFWYAFPPILAALVFASLPK